MKNLIIYVLVLGAAFLVSPNRSDVGKLQPVELVSVYREDEWVIIETDTEDLGRGATVDDAIRNLKETTAGIVYLDTADYLIVQNEAMHLIPEMANHLKEKVRVCSTNGGVVLQDAVKYLDSHPPKVKLGHWETGTKLEILSVRGERMILKFDQEN